MTLSHSNSMPAIYVITVKLSNGQMNQYSYAVPTTQDGIADLIARTTARIDDAFNPATSRGFILENPLVIYNLDHVMAISVDGLSDEQLSELARKTEQKLGFQANK